MTSGSSFRYANRSSLPRQFRPSWLKCAVGGYIRLVTKTGTHIPANIRLTQNTMKPYLRKIFFWDEPAQGDAEMKSFRMRIQAQILRLRRIQMICLPTIVIAFIGLMFTASSLELNGAFRAFFTVFGAFAFLGELYCFFKARGLTCPKCRKRIGYLLLDSSHSKNGALLMPDNLPSDIHQWPILPCRLGTY